MFEDSAKRGKSISTSSGWYSETKEIMNVIIKKDDDYKYIRWVLI